MLADLIGMLRTAAEEAFGAGVESVIAFGSVACGQAIRAGVRARDAIVTALTGATRKAKDHATAAKDLRTAFGQAGRGARRGGSAA